MCDHAGFWSCESRYDRERRRLAYSMRCDGCGETMRQLGEEGYEPRPLVDTDSPAACPPLAA